MAALLGAKDIARAADLQIAHGNAEARAELRKLPNGGQALFRRFGQRFLRLHGEIGIGYAVGTPHAAAQLIQLGQAEAVGVIDDHGIGARHIQAVFNDGGAQQHIVLAGVEIQHHILQRVLLHLAMPNGDACFGHQLAQAARKGVDVGHAIIKEINLTVAGNLAQDGVAHQAFVIVHHIGLHGDALLGRGFQQAHIAHAHHAHVQRARDGRGAEGEHIHALFQVFDALLVRYAKALLLVDNQQPQILKLHILAQQPVGAHQDIALARGGMADGLALRLGRAEAADHIDIDREIMEALEACIIVLLRQDGSGRQQRHLLAILHRLEGRAHGHLGFAVAHVAA